MLEGVCRGRRRGRRRSRVIPVTIDLAAIILSPMQHASRWRAGGWLAVAALSLIGFYLRSYGDCLGAFFHLDDFSSLATASHIEIRSPGDIAQIFRPTLGFVFYRPLSTVLYFHVLHHAFGCDPRGYHAVQLAFQIANALLVYAIAKRLFGSGFAALASALVYASAPGHAFAACCVSVFTVTGTAFFYFLAVWVWLQSDSRWRTPTTLVLFILALLSNELALTLPLVLTLEAVLLRSPFDWRRTVREQAVFYLIAGAYTAAKLYHVDYLFAPTAPNDLGKAFIWANYRFSFEPRSVVGVLGHYFGFGLDVAYDLARSETWALALGALLVGLAVVSTLCVTKGWWVAHPLRVATFGLDLFIVALGPVLILATRVSSYCVGIAALGMALALVGFVRALPRLSGIATGLVVAAVLAVHVGSTNAAVRQSNEFPLFYRFSQQAAAWINALTSIREDQGVEEVVVPRDLVTSMLFDAGDAQRVFLGAHYRVRTSDTMSGEQPNARQVLLRRAAPLPAGACPDWACICRGDARR